MKERPILFSAPMVRALIAGTKTQTRRSVKPQPQMVADRSIKPWSGDPAFLMQLMHDTGKKCPYGQPGDRLWVREAFRFLDSFDSDSPTAVGERCLKADYPKPWAPTQYEADGYRDNWMNVGATPGSVTPGKLRPGIHMPRWASRITLEVVSARVERLNDITVSDAIAEGYDGSVKSPVDPSIQWYADVWESLNGAGSWAANPWVWVVEFKRVPQ